MDLAIIVAFLAITLVLGTHYGKDVKLFCNYQIKKIKILFYMEKNSRFRVARRVFFMMYLVLMYMGTSICLHATVSFPIIFNIPYDNKIYGYDFSNGEIIENNIEVKSSYKIGLILDSAISSIPTTGLLYKVFSLSREMINKGHTYVFFICNRNFTSIKEIEKLYIPRIRIHILDENLFYNKDFMTNLVTKENLDAMQFEIPQTFLKLGVPLKNKTGLPSVLVLHDIEDELMETLNKNNKQENTLLDYTHYVAGHLADSVMTLTSVDRDKRIKKHGIPSEKIFVTPIGVDRSLSYTGPNLNEKIIGLVGNQFYEPNHRATIYLIEKVLPLVQKEHPDAKLKIIGMVSSELYNSYSHRKDIKFTGEIRDESDYIRELGSFTIGTCCVDSGCGMNVKISNYCALGLPVVLTPICHTGYEDITSLDLVQLDPQKIAEKINDILHDGSRAKQIGLLNHQLIYEYLSWEKISKTLEKAISHAVSGIKTNVSTTKNIKPVWISENRHSDNILKGHYISDSRK